MIERANSRKPEEGANKPENLSCKWGSVLAASKSSCGLEKRAVSFGSTTGRSLIGSYGPDHIGLKES